MTKEGSTKILYSRIQGKGSIAGAWLSHVHVRMHNFFIRFLDQTILSYIQMLRLEAYTILL